MSEITPKQLLWDAFEQSKKELEAIEQAKKEQSEQGQTENAEQVMWHPAIFVLHTWLYDYYEDVEQRIKALEDIRAHHNEYLKGIDIPEGQKAGFVLECESLISYHKIIQDLLTDTSIQTFYKINKDSVSIPQLEQYIYLLKLPDLDLYLNHYIAFTEGFCFYATRPLKQPAVAMAVIKCENFLGKLHSEDIMAFCRHLFCGESMRLHEMGELGDNDPFGIHEFDVAFRNRCFDVYIDLRKKEIAQEMASDNDRPFPPTNIDYLNQLLEESKYVFEREMQFEQFKGSYAYEQQYYKGRPDVLKMVGYFVTYLITKINELNTQQPIATPKPANIRQEGLPRERKYQELIDWLEKEKQNGRDHYKEASNPVAPFDWKLLPFIHPQWLGNDVKCHSIYAHIKSIICQDASVVCSQLLAMHDSQLLMLSGVQTKTVYSHLKNMGFTCPESTFYDKYKAPK